MGQNQKQSQVICVFLCLGSEIVASGIKDIVLVRERHIRLSQVKHIYIYTYVYSAFQFYEQIDTCQAIYGLDHPRHTLEQ